jgi:hypothetical protein
MTCILSITTTHILVFTTETQALLYRGRQVCSQTLLETVQLVATQQFHRVAQSAAISD